MENHETTTAITFARTSISVGLIIADLLANDIAVAAIASEVFPVVTDEATLPYVSFCARKMEALPVKGVQGSETLLVDICCFAATYAESVGLAECVRAALDGRQRTMDGLTMRSCLFEDREETWEDDAYVQRLTFRIKV